MKYFLDSAKMDEIKEAYETFGIDGVTTNPKHIQNSGKPFLTAVQDMADWAKEQGFKDYNDFPISVEVNPHLETAEEIMKMARELHAISPCFVIKIPCIPGGVEAARKLEKEGIRTNLTLVFSPAQAIWAGKFGCKFVSPFIGWKESNGEDCRQYIQDIVDIYANFDWLRETEIICAAIRTPKQFVDCAVAGADIVTAGLAVYKDAIAHPYTDMGMGRFTAAWDATAGN